MAEAPGDSSGGNRGLCGSENNKKSEIFVFSEIFVRRIFSQSICHVTPVGVGGAMMSVQIFLVISCRGANSYKSNSLNDLTTRKEFTFSFIKSNSVTK